MKKTGKRANDDWCGKKGTTVEVRWGGGDRVRGGGGVRQQEEGSWLWHHGRPAILIARRVARYLLPLPFFSRVLFFFLSISYFNLSRFYFFFISVPPLCFGLRRLFASALGERFRLFKFPRGAGRALQETSFISFLIYIFFISFFFGGGRWWDCLDRAGFVVRLVHRSHTTNWSGGKRQINNDRKRKRAPH